MEMSPSTRWGNMRESPRHTPKLTEKDRKIATPPSRGRGDSWTWRPSRGRETHPRRVAMSRTWRVAINDTAKENANTPKNRSVTPHLPFRLKHPAFQAKLAERIFRLFFQTKFSYRAQKIRNFWLQELYIPRLALGKVLAAAGKDTKLLCTKQTAWVQVQLHNCYSSRIFAKWCASRQEP